jgi:hypothetical protein
MAPQLPAFAITSDRLTNPAVWNSGGASWSNVTTGGFSMDTAGDLYSCYLAQVTNSDTDITTAFTRAGETAPYGEGYLWNPSFRVTPGEVPPLAKVGYDSGNKRIFILPLDSYSTNVTDPGNGGTPLTGTYEFPVIFTAFEPATDKSGWC